MLPCLLPILISAGCAASPARNEYNPSLDAWPILRIWSDPDRRAHHGEALGPLLEWRSDPEAGAFFFRPLYNRRHDKDLHLVQSEWLWPFGTGTFRPDLAREVFYPLAVWDNETFPDGGLQKRRILLPLFYYRSGRSPTDWFLLPFGGVLHDFLGRKKIVIALWPLYVYQAGDNVRSWSFLHPIFTFIRWHDGGTGYKFWPLFGVNRRPGKLSKTFILWPIYQKQWMKSQDGEFNRLFIFPFYGKIDDPAGWEWTVLWPFISHRVNHNSGRDDLWYFWPFFGRKSGRGVSGRSFWPICSWETERHETDGLEVKHTHVGSQTHSRQLPLAARVVPRHTSRIRKKPPQRPRRNLRRHQAPGSPEKAASPHRRHHGRAPRSPLLPRVGTYPDRRHRRLATLAAHQIPQ